MDNFELQNFVGMNNDESRSRGEKKSLLSSINRSDSDDSSNTDNDSDTETLLRM